MGVIENSNENVMFVKIADGKMYYKTTETDPYAKTETYGDNNENVIYKHFIRGIEGLLINVEFKETKFGDIFILMLKDSDNKKIVLQIKPRSSLFLMIANQLFNVNFEIPLTIKTATDKKKHYITQDGKWVGFKFTKDNKGESPDVIKRKSPSGNEIYDFTAIYEFYEEYIKNNIIPKLSSNKFVNNNSESAQEYTLSNNDKKENAQIIEEDDLPF